MLLPTDYRVVILAMFPPNAPDPRPEPHQPEVAAIQAQWAHWSALLCGART